MKARTITEKMKMCKKRTLMVMLKGRDYITSELARILKIDAQRMYRCLVLLEKEGKVKKHFWGQNFWRRRI